MSEWARVRNKIPRQGQVVLVYGPGMVKPVTAKFANDRFLDYGMFGLSEERWSRNITDWMPLPSPPK